MHIIIKIFCLFILTLSSYVYAGDSAKLCIQWFDNGDYSKAINVCQIAAEQGDAASQTVLGEMYDAGNGINIDQKMVAKWWTKASNSSYLPAQNLLALKYYYGGDVFGSQSEWQQDYVRAFDIWKKSAVKGVATSQYMLGEMYLHGQGVSTDYAEAYAWFKIALEGGYKLATDSLMELSRIITAKQKQVGLTRINTLKRTIAGQH